MKELSFVDVRAAGLPARARLEGVTYDYRPLSDEVAVRITYGRWPYLGTTRRMPESGWLHEAGCLCRFCRTGEEAPE